MTGRAQSLCGSSELVYRRCYMMIKYIGPTRVSARTEKDMVDQWE